MYENNVSTFSFLFKSASSLTNDDIKLSERLYIPGKKLRGFESGKIGPVDGTDHVGGNYAASLNLEASLPNLLPDSSNADIGIFLDFANVWGVDYDSSLDESNKLRSSTGVAMNWLSPVGPLSFVLATNLSKASTDQTQTFNFNLGTSF